MVELDQENMVVIDGVRYTREDAERLGLLKDADKAASKPSNKSRSASNKGKD